MPLAVNAVWQAMSRCEPLDAPGDLTAVSDKSRQEDVRLSCGYCQKTWSQPRLGGDAALLGRHW